MTEVFEEIVAVMEMSVSTKRKRHILGGALLSISLLFAGLAITAITLKTEDDYEQ